MKALFLAALAACSVPSVSLDGKACPCPADYTCNQATNTCVRADDGGTDGQILPSCLSGSTGATLYAFSGATTFDWQGTGGTWSGANGVIMQTDTSNTLSSRYTTHVAATSYRVSTRMRQTGSSNQNGSIGVALRVQLTSPKAHYECDWLPRAGILVIGKTNTGGNPTALMTQSVAGADPNAAVTMDAQVSGTAPATLSCCLRELPAAKILNVSDADFAAGPPGLTADRMAGEFTGYQVTQP